jgi:hypothetical protein
VTRHSATFRLIASVEFDDNGEDDLRDQAFEALMEKYSFSPEQDFEAAEIIGEVEAA